MENSYDPEPDLTRKTTWKEFIKSHWNVLAACDFFSIELLVKGKLVRCTVLFAIDLSTRKVEILSIRPQPNGPWMEQIARNLTCEDSFPATSTWRWRRATCRMFLNRRTESLRIAGSM